MWESELEGVQDKVCFSQGNSPRNRQREESLTDPF